MENIPEHPLMENILELYSEQPLMENILEHPLMENIPELYSEHPLMENIPELYSEQPLMENILELFTAQPLTVNILEPSKHQKSVMVNILKLFTLKEYEFTDQHSRIFLVTLPHKHMPRNCSLATANRSPLQPCSDKVEAVDKLASYL